MASSNRLAIAHAQFGHSAWDWIMACLRKNWAGGDDVKGDTATLEDFSVLAKLRTNED